jgi:hypothetical protein
MGVLGRRGCLRASAVARMTMPSTSGAGKHQMKDRGVIPRFPSPGGSHLKIISDIRMKWLAASWSRFLR